MDTAAAQYRKLLTAEESVASLDKAMRLLRAVVPFVEWPKRATRAGSARIQTVIWSLSVLAKNLEDRASDLSEAQYSLARDLLLLIFHHAYFAALPTHGRDRSELLKAFSEFAATISCRSDQLQVLGLVSLAQEEFEDAAESFRSAIATTHSDDHDFITRVQILWTLLMEKHRWLDAFQLLTDVYPRVPRADIEEVSNLLDSTFREATQSSRKGRLVGS